MLTGSLVAIATPMRTGGALDVVQRPQADPHQPHPDHGHDGQHEHPDQGAEPGEAVQRALHIGQILAAVFPGTSRSAATIFAAMLAGMTSRPAAAEFAFIVGIPTMFAATAYELLELYQEGQVASEPWGELGVGFAVSAIVAFISVKWLLVYIQTHRFTPFAWYRIAFGILLLALVQG